MPLDPARTTSLLTDACQGNPTAADDLLQLVYSDLRAVASQLLDRERAGHTLQPTALVHEAWMRLIDQQCLSNVDSDEARRRFIGLAAHAMRQVLVDHARRRNRDKRGGGMLPVTLSTAIPIAATTDCATILDLEAALVALQQRSERLARVAELRIFGGLSTQEAANVVGVSLATAKADWALAQALLTKSMRDTSQS
ncbi:MAG: ECF-type sigma factor [Planctomycetota bacterium]